MLNFSDRVQTFVEMANAAEDSLEGERNICKALFQLAYDASKEGIEFSSAWAEVEAAVGDV